MDRAVARALGALVAAGAPGALATVVRTSGSAPQRVGARLLVCADGSFVGTIGGGVVEARVLEDARARVGGAGRGELRSYALTAELGMCCGGTMEVFVEPIRSAARAVIFGAGHVAAPTADLAARVGFDVVVIDDRPDWNSAERFPRARRVVELWVDFFATWTPAAADHVLVLTRSHDDDQAILERVCAFGAATGALPCAYVGMIGSRRKAEKAMRRLEASGVPEPVRRAIHTPVGLDLGAESPDEIAVAIVAELVRERAAREGRLRSSATAEALASAPSARDA